MSTVIKHCSVNGFYICLEVRFEGMYIYYNVEVCIEHFKGICGSPINQVTYNINNRKNALRTYNRYVKKYSTI